MRAVWLVLGMLHRTLTAPDTALVALPYSVSFWLGLTAATTGAVMSTVGRPLACLITLKVAFACARAASRHAGQRRTWEGATTWR